MNDIREIVTRAVLAKGRKIIRVKEKLDTYNTTSVLGCWIINHQFETTLEDHTVTLVGSFENNVWYSYDNNTKTDVARKVTEYETKVKVREVVSDSYTNSCDVVARILQEPIVTNAVVVEDGIEIDICFEVLVEVIGETKMMVNIVNCIDPNADVDDFENEINEDFLNEG